MNVLFLSVKDLDNSEYLRIKQKNLLKTEFGVGDTIALCGKLESVEKTDYGPRFWINDGEKIGIIAGTFNKEVRKDAEKIAEFFRKTNNEKEIYLLLYGNPYFQDKVYINVNNENSIILVDKKFYEKFHDLRIESKEYLMKKIEISTNFVDKDDIMNFVKTKCLKFGFISIDEIEKKFSNLDKEILEKKILDLLESGKFYEPKAGIIKMI